MSRMFYDATSFNGDISKWDVSRVKDMSVMFMGAKLKLSPNGDHTDSPHDPIGEWDVSRVTDMTGTFHDAKTFNEDISKWDVSRVTNMRGLFFDAKTFNSDISNWDVSRVWRTMMTMKKMMMIV